jgi:serine/threonine-protein kinase
MTRADFEETAVEPSQRKAARPRAPPNASEDSETRAAARLITLTSTLAVRREQSERTRAVLLAGIFVSLLTLLAWLLPGVVTGGPAEVPATLGLFGVIGCSAVILLLYRPPRLVPEAAVSAFGAFATFAILTVTYYVGVFTPAVMAAFVTLYYFALGDSAARAWGIFLALAVGYAVMAALYVLDLRGSRASVFVLDRPEPIAMIALTAVVEVYLGLTFWLGRLSRRATLEAMALLESAHEQIRQREALLNEARADFERQLDASKLGRLTGHAIGPLVAQEVIGRGAMGEVYLAIDRASQAECAVKILHPLVGVESGHVERFMREVRISSELDSPHIVRVTNSGLLEDGTPWLAMDLLKGRVLAEILRDRGRISLKETIDLVTQVARGLAVAHGAGIVHRDIKPQNVFLSERDSARVWKILDFGVSTFEHEAGTLTRGTMIGTPSYMSPEQTRGKKVDHRADIFALGVIAYRAVTGRPAFTGADVMHTMYNVAHVMPVRPGSLVRLPEDVDRVLALALAKDRDERFDSAPLFAAALHDAARSELDAALRVAADRLVAFQPWGTELDDTPTSFRLPHP